MSNNSEKSSFFKPHLNLVKLKCSFHFNSFHNIILNIYSNKEYIIISIYDTSIGMGLYCAAHHFISRIAQARTSIFRARAPHKLSAIMPPLFTAPDELELKFNNIISRYKFVYMRKTTKNKHIRRIPHALIKCTSRHARACIQPPRSHIRSRARCPGCIHFIHTYIYVYT